MNTPDAVATMKDVANLQLGNAIADVLKASKGAKRSGIKTLKQTKALSKQKFRRFPTKGKTSTKPRGFNAKTNKYRRTYGNTQRKRLIGLNQKHQRKFKQHVTGMIVPSSHVSGHISFPLKEYQIARLKYYPHEIYQKILLLGNQEVVAGSDNNLAEKVLYEDFPHVLDKKLISTVYYPITGPASFSGIHAFTRMQSDADSEGFSKISCLGRQNRCDEQNQLDITSASTITSSINNYMANPNAILKMVRCRLVAQSNRNYRVKIVCQLLRLSNPGDVISNQGISNDELVECTNSVSHIDYDTAEIIFQQTKVLQPCKANKYVHESFDLKWTGQYHQTKSYKDETALTVKTDQGGTYKYGQGALPKISGAFLSQTNLSNRLVVLIKAIRVGETQIGIATQTKEFVEVGITKTVGVQQPYNQEDSDAYMSNVTGHANVLPTDNYIGDELTTASFRCKAELELVWGVKDAVRNIPIYITSDAKNGKTRILNASTYDSNYGTLNAALNVTD